MAKCEMFSNNTFQSQLRMKPMDNKYPHVIYVEDVLPEGSDIKRQAKDPVEGIKTCKGSGYRGLCIQSMMFVMPTCF